MNSNLMYFIAGVLIGSHLLMLIFHLQINVPQQLPSIRPLIHSTRKHANCTLKAEPLKSPKHYLSMVAIFQNEDRFLKEWIEFHRLMGVEHFYLFNHLSTDHFMDILNPYINMKIVELENVTEKPTNRSEWEYLQRSVYGKAA